MKPARNLALFAIAVLGELYPIVVGCLIGSALVVATRFLLLAIGVEGVE